jgi:toxin ParE1/3/4
LRVTLRILWSEQADADLDAIYAWIAGEAGPEVALRYVLRIETAAEKLVDFPNRGRSRDEIRPGLRSIPFAHSISIFYAVSAGEVQIVRVINARRDLDSALESD